MSALPQTGLRLNSSLSLCFLRLYWAGALSSRAYSCDGSRRCAAYSFSTDEHHGPNIFDAQVAGEFASYMTTNVLTAQKLWTGILAGPKSQRFRSLVDVRLLRATTAASALLGIDPEVCSCYVAARTLLLAARCALRIILGSRRHYRCRESATGCGGGCQRTSRRCTRTRTRPWRWGHSWRSR